MSAPHLELCGISHRFGATRVLEGVSLAVERGEFVVLLGPSGCGKSTLLRIVAGLVRAEAGELWIDGQRAEELEPVERGVALVFQNYALYPHLTVRGNLAFPLEMARVAKAERARRVEETARLLHLEELLERKPEALSGGQMQRVALGRALVRRPALCLFDEPLSNLDAALRGELRGEIARVVKALGTTALYVTHDQAEAMTLATRLVVLAQGKIEQVGAPLEVHDAPATRFVAGFVGSPPMNLVVGEARGDALVLGELALARPAGVPDGPLLVGIRPGDVRAGRGRALPLRRIERFGHETHLELELAGRPFLVVQPGRGPADGATALAVELPAERLHLFDAASGRRIAAGAAASL
jgi:ABC-type sugar transport system ATPase subunit